MKTYILSKESYQLLSKIDLEEMGSSVVFLPKRNAIQTNNIRLLLIILTEEINVRGLTEDQQRATQYGRKLYDLYDELLMQCQQ